MNIEYLQDDLSDGAVVNLLQVHLLEMYNYSPKESIHAINPQQFKDKSVTFWSARDNGKIAGCAGLKVLSADVGELKSMKTHKDYLRQGIGEALLTLIGQRAKQLSLKKLYLETGSHQAFEPAIQLYKKHGFVECGPFAEYKLDSYSRFFVKNCG